jgi:hypothetical protein
MSEYYAHSENSFNEKHSLSKHLHQTAKYAESFAWNENYKTIFKITGLLHDLGKYQFEFQRYLTDGGERGVFRTHLGELGMRVFARSLRHQLRLTGTIKDCQTTHSGSRKTQNHSFGEKHPVLIVW